VPEIMHGRAPEVFLHQLSLNVAIWPILCRCDVKSKTNKQAKTLSFKWLILKNQNCIIITSIIKSLHGKTGISYCLIFLHKFSW
jgi:hypothetical protein